MPLKNIWGYISPSKGEKESQERLSQRQNMLRGRPENVSEELWSIAVDIAREQGRDEPNDDDIARASTILLLNKEKRPKGFWGAGKTEGSSATFGFKPKEEKPDDSRVEVNPDVKKPPTTTGAAATPSLVKEGRQEDSGAMTEREAAPPPGGAQVKSDLIPDQESFFTRDAKDYAVGGNLEGELELDTAQIEMDEQRQDKEKWEKWENVAAMIGAMGQVVAMMERANAERAASMRAASAGARGGLGSFDTGKKMDLQGGGASGFRLGSALRRRR